MRKTSILNKLNCKTQAHVRVCEENSEEENKKEKKTTAGSNFLNKKDRL